MAIVKVVNDVFVDSSFLKRRLLCSFSGLRGKGMDGDLYAGLRGEEGGKTSLEKGALGRKRDSNGRRRESGCEEDSIGAEIGS